MAGVYDAAVSEQMSQIGKEKKRRPGGLLDSELSSYLSKSAKHLCAALGGGGAAVKVWRVCFLEPLLLRPAEHVALRGRDGKTKKTDKKISPERPCQTGSPLSGSRRRR